MVDRPPPITDSPLFWLTLFGSVGLVMLTAVEPKFEKRQQRIERMQQSRHLGRQASSPSAAARSSSEPTDVPTWQPPHRRTLKPLALFLAAVLAAAMAAMYVRRQRLAHRKAHAVEEGNRS